MTHFGRQGSLRLAKYFDQNEPGLRRRGSLPYELGRKLSGHESAVGRLIPGSSDVKFDIGVRRGSAPSDLLRNTGASIASCWIQFRDRVKMKVFRSFFFFLNIGFMICCFFRVFSSKT